MSRLYSCNYIFNLFTEDVRVKTIRVSTKPGKKWELPEVLCFHRYGGSYAIPSMMRFYEVNEFRCPKAGEWFISGAIPNAYYAQNDISSEYLIAIPTDKAKRVTKWVRA